MSKEKRVVDFYVLCNRLKDVVRTGWKDWGVKRERVESVAEHIFGVQMLAIAMWSQYDYDLDLSKVIMMLAIHETEEIVIGDITVFEKTHDKAKAEKSKHGHEEVAKIFKNLSNADEVANLIYEFDECKTSEARFARFCDKLECDIQAKLYDEEGCVDLENQENNSTAKDARVQELLNQGMSWSEMWMTFGQQRYNYDDNFLAVSNYAKDHSLLQSEANENE